MSFQRKSISSPKSRNEEAIPGSETPRQASLLPSPFPNDEGFGGSSEGYEGERLAALFFSGTHGRSHFPPRQSPDNLEHNEVLEDTDGSHEPDEEEQPPGFAPFFTLVEDTTTGEQHHPYVHYIFFDDEPEIITNALIGTLDPDNDRADELSPQESSRQGSKERYLILDIGKDGQSLISAKSLAEDWQITRTQVGAAPTFDDHASEDAGIMLRVQGSQSVVGEENHRNPLRRAKDASNGDVFAAMNSLASQFQEEQDALNKLVESTGVPFPSN